jgi:hypothetical protein
MFHQIEGYVNDFLNYVPIDINHLEVYSLKLITIILEIGPELMNSFELAVSESNIGVLEFLSGSIRKDLKTYGKKKRNSRVGRGVLHSTIIIVSLTNMGYPN